MRPYRRTPARLLRRDRKRRYTRRALLIIIFIMLLGASGWFLYTPSFRIATVAVSGGETLDVRSVESTALATLSGKFLGIIPKNNVFFIPREELKKGIIALSPKIKDVRFDIKDRHILGVNITERLPLAIWCMAPEDCFFIDEEGISFERSGKHMPRGAQTSPPYAVFTNEKRQLCALGCKAVSNEALALFATAENVFRKEGVGIYSLHHDNVDDYTIHTDTNTDILLSGSVPVLETLDNVFSLLDSDVFTGSLKERLAVLSRVDARFGKKIYYTYKEE